MYTRDAFFRQLGLRCHGWIFARAIGMAVLFTASAANVCGVELTPGPADKPVAPTHALSRADDTAASPSRPLLATPTDAPAEPSYLVPMMEVVGFELLVNRSNRFFGTEQSDYRVTGSSIKRNLGSSWESDRDPFEVNQLGHPYQGAMYFGIARSAGFDYWHSLAFSFGGSALWEIAGETTHPSRNDQMASGIGGTFLGEAMFRMSSLLLQEGGGLPPLWRELAAFAIDPAVGFNRLAYGERYGGVFANNGAAYFSRLELGFSHSVKRDLGSSRTDFKRNEAHVDFALDYGVPGSADYEYNRPFDYFNFQTILSSANGVENVMTRGLLVGRRYAAGQNYRGVWGIYGSYDYFAPQTFRVSSTAVSLGTTGQRWLGEALSVQGTALLGVGYAAVGTTRGRVDERTYNYGIAPQALLALRITQSDAASLDLTAREYFVSGLASGTSGGRDNIIRGEASLTFRIAKQQAISFKVLANRRDATFGTRETRRQTQVTVGISYTLLGQERFGAVDWR